MKFHFENERAIFTVLVLKVNILFLIYHSIYHKYKLLKIGKYILKYRYYFPSG